MRKPAQIGLEEGAGIGDAVFQHGDALDAEAEGEALEFVGVDAAIGQHLGMDHAAAANLEPIAAAADLEPAAAALTADSDRGRGFGDGAAGRTEARYDLLPYQGRLRRSAENPLEIYLGEPIQLLREWHELGVATVNISCGSPYYNPHIQRPACFPPSDGYLPPEDPLAGVCRQIHVTRQCKEAVPDLPEIKA